MILDLSVFGLTMVSNRLWSSHKNAHFGNRKWGYRFAPRGGRRIHLILPIDKKHTTKAVYNICGRQDDSCGWDKETNRPRTHFLAGAASINESDRCCAKSGGAKNHARGLQTFRLLSNSIDTLINSADCTYTSPEQRIRTKRIRDGR